MQIPRSIAWFFLFVSSFISCKPDKEVTPSNPVINLLSVYSLDATQAEAKIELSGMSTNPNGEYGVVWSENPNPTVSANKKTFVARPENGISALQFSELPLGTTLYVKAYVRLGEAYYYSNEVSLLHQAPFVWQSLTGIEWSDKSNWVSSVALGNGIVVVRPTDEFITEVWYYFAGSNIWAQQKDLIFKASRFEPLLFKLNKFGDEATYFGGGYQIRENIPGKYIYQKDFWQYGFFYGGTEEEYPDFPFGYSTLTHFTLDNRTYVIENRAERNVWMLLNGVSWHKQNNFPGPFLGNFVGFSIGAKGYILIEEESLAGKTKSLYEYNPDTDTWLQKADFPGEDRVNGVAFSVKGKGYYGLGQAKNTPNGLRDIWQYNPEADTWQKFTDYPGLGNVQVTANTIGDKAYLGIGLRVKPSLAGAEEYQPASDFWEFNP
ncbi:hypothetical protein HUW51_10015 [Adhaeribacter swui]|uniref:Galactose oxidase n=1 Tax=Adhaeribacter swui TaxID=2086471 RepID=A0A7G7G7B7_9BACT|nr:hypothetical protein [Adhaeribacter swui]QNF33051.1 hypothetical protein HUW51_10015 [Adhaeribacter swui]